MPIVAIGDPVADDLVTNWMKPEANVTGLSLSESPEISGKRLELLKQAVPSITRVAVLVLPHVGNHARHLKHTQDAAKILGMSVQPIALERPFLIENAFSKMVNPQAVLILPFAMDIPDQRERILQSAAKKRLPTMYTGRNFVRRGGFMSYGPVRLHTWKRAAAFID